MLVTVQPTCLWCSFWIAVPHCLLPNTLDSLGVGHAGSIKLRPRALPDQSYFDVLSRHMALMTEQISYSSPFVGVQGKPSPLLSSFRLSYYTLLNLMKRVEGGTHDLEYVIANSFQQFQQEQAMPKVSTGSSVKS